MHAAHAGCQKPVSLRIRKLLFYPTETTAQKPMRYPAVRKTSGKPYNNFYQQVLKSKQLLSDKILINRLCDKHQYSECDPVRQNVLPFRLELLFIYI